MRHDLVIVGLGYVGLPLAREACRAGLATTGFDIDEATIDELKLGKSHVGDVRDGDLEEMLTAGFAVTNDETVLGEASTVIICVPTPLNGDGGPDLSAVHGAARAVARHMPAGTLVVLESTTYPGTTDEIVRPLLEESGMRAGEDFHLAFSPERIDPGNAEFSVDNTPKVVGGHTAACGGAAAAVYGKLVGSVVQAAGTREAEMAKLLENTYRHVNIALVNEMAVFCRELGIDLWDSISCAATKPFGFQSFYPGPGVGGHCIPIDPSYLSYTVRTGLGFPFRFVELAQEINQRMPTYVVQRTQDALNREGLAVKGATVLLLGVTYKPDVADQRESPARPVARKLRALGARLLFHDPHVTEWEIDGERVPRVSDAEAAALSADVTVLLQPHREYDPASLSITARMLDTTGRSPAGQAERL